MADHEILHITEEEIKKSKRINNTKPVIYIGMGTCGLASGAQAVLNKIESELEKNKIEAEIVKVGCVGACFVEPIVDIKLPGRTRVGFYKVTEDLASKLVESFVKNSQIPTENIIGQYIQEGDIPFENIKDVSEFHYFKGQMKFVTSHCGVIDPLSLRDYVAYKDGFKALKMVLESQPMDIISKIKTSGLRGRGGAGFPTGQKWEFAYKAKGDQKYVIMNADEGDPGAFMDRSVLESDPFSCLEGMMIIGRVIGANKGYIYCRAEYPLAIENLTKAINTLREQKLLGKNIMGTDFEFDIFIKKGAGAFVCGEETALIESVEGKRGMPRLKPPFPANAGLFQKPTVINNVETIAQIAKILLFGPEKFAAIGTKGSKGTKVFALTGKIACAGLVEVPMGTTIKQIIEIGGGIANGKKFKAVQIGGPSGGCIPQHLIETPIDYENLKSVGAMMGSGGLVVMDEDTCMVDTARFFMNFIEEESCGKCIPCREGTLRLLETLKKLVVVPKNDKEVLDRMKSMIYLERLCTVIQDTALCGLGMSAPNPVLSTLRYFRNEYEEHLYENKCSAKYCIGLLNFKIDAEKCIGCGLCKMNCPAEAIVGEKKKAHYILNEKCIKCGLCKTNCKFNAVLLE